MLPPTIATLRELAEFATAAEVLAAADDRDIAPVLPRVVVDGDEVELLLPHEKGYDVVTETPGGTAARAAPGDAAARR